MDEMDGMIGRITRSWPAWLAATVSYPLAGIAGLAVAGSATTWTAAIVAGSVAGLVIGGAQALAMTPRRPDVRWAVATAAGSGIGLAISVMLGLAPLATGLVMGALIGVAQTSMLRYGTAEARRATLAWPLVVAVAWGLGWTVTTAIGVVPAAGWAGFGLAGALASQVTTLVGALAIVRTTAAVPA
jgi:hypothetical protein